MFATLTPEQWRTPSLCAGWTLREVAAHLLEPLETEVGTLELLVYLARYRGSLDRMVDDTARKVAARPTDELVTGLRERAATRLTPPVIGPLGPMTDTCIHLRDAARPLGLDVCPPPASWRPALDFLVCKRPPRASYPATDSLACASSPLTKTGGTVTGRRSSAAARPSPWQSPDDQPPSTTSPAPASTYSVAGSRRPHRSRRRSGRPETRPVSRRTIVCGTRGAVCSGWCPLAVDGTPSWCVSRPRGGSPGPSLAEGARATRR